MHNVPWLKAGLRLIIAFGLLAGTAVAWGDHYLELLLPLYREVVAAAGPEYLLSSLSLAMTANGEPVIAAELTTRNAFLLGGGVVPAGITIDASTLTGHALQHPTVLFAVALAWPVSRAVQRVTQIAISIVLLAIIECLDVPLVLLGSAHDLLYANIAVSGATPSWVVTWMNAMNGGGRLALSVAAAVLASAAVVNVARAKTNGSSTLAASNPTIMSQSVTKDSSHRKDSFTLHK
jgi:hypothetical protein